MPQVQMPPGCESLKFSDGKQYYGRPGGHVNVADEHARQIARSGNGRLGIVSGTQALVLGTKRGNWCLDCGRLWQAWSTRCPRCGAQTVPQAGSAGTPA
jgi:hypothetical protein